MASTRSSGSMWPGALVRGGLGVIFGVLDTSGVRDYARCMTSIAYRARALGPLRAIDWMIPPGVSVVVGPNRVGKSTLLRVPTLIRFTLTEGVHEAFKSVFEGVPHLRNLRVPPSTPMVLGLTDGSLEWEVDLTVHGGQIADLPSERLAIDGNAILWRKPGNKEVEGEGFRFLHTGFLPSLALNIVTGYVEDGKFIDVKDLEVPEFVAKLRQYLPPHAPDQVVNISLRMIEILSHAMTIYSYRTYHYETNHLLRFGSAHSSSLFLYDTGENVFPLLRNWRDRLELEERYEFVLATMREIFPHLGRVGFEQAGQTSTMVVSDRRWPSDTLIPVARESTGFITALLHLCALASCPRGGLVTFDELETSLHPRAIRVLVEACRSWAARHNLRVVIATQSQTVLDQFREEPSQVFVLEPGQEVSPQSLTDLFSPEYLSQFSLGDLFAHLEFGGDSDDEPAA